MSKTIKTVRNANKMLHVYPFKSQKPVKASRTLDPYKLFRLVFKPLRTSPDNLSELVQGLSDGSVDQEPGITLAKILTRVRDRFCQTHIVIHSCSCNTICICEFILVLGVRFLFSNGKLCRLIFCLHHVQIYTSHSKTESILLI